MGMKDDIKAAFSLYTTSVTYHRKMRLPVVPGLRLTPDGMMHLKGQTMPVLGSVAKVDTTGSVNRTGGMFLHSKHDDRENWLTIEGPDNIFQVALKGPQGSKYARKLANYINVANKTHREG